MRLKLLQGIRITKLTNTTLTTKTRNYCKLFNDWILRIS